MTLASHEQQQVDTAVFNNCACAEMDCGHGKSFRRGVDFAIQHLFAGRAVADPDVLREILGPFAEWVNALYCNDGDLHLWRALGTLNYYSDSELISKYLQHLQTIKQKEDDQRGI